MLNQLQNTLVKQESRKQVLSLDILTQMQAVGEQVLDFIIGLMEIMKTRKRLYSLNKLITTGELSHNIGDELDVLLCKMAISFTPEINSLRRKIDDNCVRINLLMKSWRSLRLRRVNREPLYFQTNGERLKLFERRTLALLDYLRKDADNELTRNDTKDLKSSVEILLHLIDNLRLMLCLLIGNMGRMSISDTSYLTAPLLDSVAVTSATVLKLECISSELAKQLSRPIKLQRPIEDNKVNDKKNGNDQSSTTIKDRSQPKEFIEITDKERLSQIAFHNRIIKCKDAVDKLLRKPVIHTSKFELHPDKILNIEKENKEDESSDADQDEDIYDTETDNTTEESIAKQKAQHSEREQKLNRRYAAERWKNSGDRSRARHRKRKTQGDSRK
ncbi:hypothetical protein GJ496_006274 [Pomphorhynchus laevis]|nr:hypothetical protein GJ496_006274 [Pomphorhynchus laevis]